MNRSDKKRIQILDTAKELFWKHGFKRVSIEEICKKADVSKMTFYKHFNNKIELVKYILDMMFDGTMETYRSFMDSDMPFHKKVEKSIELKMEGTNEMSDEFLHDYMQSDNAELMSYMSNKRKESVQVVLKDYLEAQKRGDIRQDIKPEFILYFINHMFDMAKDPSLELIYQHPQEMIMELTRFFFYGIMGSHPESNKK